MIGSHCSPTRKGLGGMENAGIFLIPSNEFDTKCEIPIHSPLLLQKLQSQNWMGWQNISDRSL